jgi:hypothetical protein
MKSVSVHSSQLIIRRVTETSIYTMPKQSSYASSPYLPNPCTNSYLCIPVPKMRIHTIAYAMPTPTKIRDFFILLPLPLPNFNTSLEPQVQSSGRALMPLVLLHHQLAIHIYQFQTKKHTKRGKRQKTYLLHPPPILPIKGISSAQ